VELYLSSPFMYSWCGQEQFTIFFKSSVNNFFVVRASGNINIVLLEYGHASVPWMAQA